MHRMAAGMATGLAGLVLLGVVGAVAPTAHAQAGEQEQRRVVWQGGELGQVPRGARRALERNGSRMGDRAERPPVTAEELTSYAEILELDANQRDVVAQMHAELMDTVAKLQGERETKLDEIRKKFEEQQDPSVFMEELPAFMASVRKRRDAAEKTFFDDLQLLLTAEQEGNWPTMERARRRARTLAPGMVPGDALDLIAISKEMGFAEREGVPALLETYELELDAKLQAREAARPLGGGRGMGGMMRMQFDAEEMAKQMEEMREVAVALRDLNQKYVRLISESLSTDERAALAAKVHEASFPQVYRENRTRRAFDMVLGMDSLDADQRARVNALFDDFNKQAASLNRRWADALEKDALAGSGGGMSFTTAGGAQIEILGAIGEESEAREARQARRDLDNEMYASLRGILRPDQQERLPERSEGLFGGPAGNVVFMSENVVEGEDGAVGERVIVIEMEDAGDADGVDVHVDVDEEGMDVVIDEEAVSGDGGAEPEAAGDGGR